MSHRPDRQQPHRNLCGCRLLNADFGRSTFAVGMVLGVALHFSPIDPIKAFYWSAMLNGVVAVPVMVTMMLLSMRRAIMAEFTLPLSLQILGWLATATMGPSSRWIGRGWIIKTKSRSGKFGFILKELVLKELVGSGVGA